MKAKILIFKFTPQIFTLTPFFVFQARLKHKKSPTIRWYCRTCLFFVAVWLCSYVIRLGLEPRTPTLKVLCSTCWASESILIANQLFPDCGCKDREFFINTKIIWMFFRIAMTIHSFYSCWNSKLSRLDAKALLGLWLDGK